MKKILNSAIILTILFYGITALYKYQYQRSYESKVGQVKGYQSLSDFEKDIECLSYNILMEAGIESIEGKLAVGVVTMNRVRSKQYGDTICSAVHAKSQFSWTMNNPKNLNNLRHINKEQLKISREIAKKILIEKYTIPSIKSAMFYHGDYIDTPSWARNKRIVSKIGKHIFYE